MPRYQYHLLHIRAVQSTILTLRAISPDLGSTAKLELCISRLLQYAAGNSILYPSASAQVNKSPAILHRQGNFHSRSFSAHRHNALCMCQCWAWHTPSQKKAWKQPLQTCRRKPGPGDQAHARHLYSARAAWKIIFSPGAPKAPSLARRAAKPEITCAIDSCTKVYGHA